jgi:hypothetical protein
MKKNFFAFLLLAAFAFQSVVLAQVPTNAAAAAENRVPALKISPEEKRFAEQITAQQLSDYLHFVASDEMEGRNTPSRGLDLTAKFIATLLKRWGFKPAGDNGTFFQTMDLSTYKINAASTAVSIDGKALAWGTDFLANPTSGSVANAPLVFGGAGWFVKSKNLDPLSGVDVKGKVVVVYAEGTPRGINFQQLRALGQAGTDYMDPASYAAQKGAAGVIMLSTAATRNTWDRSRGQRETGGNFQVEKFRTGGVNIPVVTLSQSASEALLAGSGTDLAVLAKAYPTADAFPAANLTKSATITVTADAVRATTQNVVALWEGSDPVLKNEMVAVGAHYDHVGVNPNAPGPDKIWNGADDDGSGTVAVLAIAEALANTPKRPKRSTLLVWHTGEEKGLWGSRYFNENPTVNIKNVIAQLNIDMIGRSKKPGNTETRDKDLSGENSIYVIGKDMMSSALGAVVDGTNSGYLNLEYDTRYDDPKDTNRFFFRSDHFNYAVNGIPIAFWFDGVHVDYHGAGDHPDKIDYAKMEKITRTIGITLLKLAEMKERPKIDKQLPPELTVRN